VGDGVREPEGVEEGEAPAERVEVGVAVELPLCDVETDGVEENEREAVCVSENDAEELGEVPTL